MHVDRGRRGRVAAAVLALALTATASLASFTNAQPALDLFDEAVFALTVQYGGFADPPPAERAPGLRTALATVCDARPDACTVDAGARAIRALISELDDAHTAYIAPDGYDGLVRRLVEPSGADGFGWVLAEDPSDGALVVARVFDHGPAHEAGLRRGDRLLDLNGTPLPSGDAGRDRLACAARDEDAATALLTVRRDGVVLPTVSATPGPFDPLPTLRMLEERVGWIEIPTFARLDTVGSAVHDRVRAATDAGARALILDVRGNPGGFVHEALVAAGAFLARPARRVEARSGASDWWFEDGVLSIRTGDGPAFPQLEVTDPVRFDGPVAVLIDARSASSAEFFALDLRDHAAATVVGERSFGVADTVTTFVGLSNGGGLQITTGRVRTADGAAYPPHVVPDVPVSGSATPVPVASDEALREAIRSLR